MEDLRKVQGYDPTPLMIRIMDKQGREALYLEVKHRKDWFLRWCEEQGKTGLLDDSDVHFNPEAKLVEGKACVYLDGKLFGVSTACKKFDPANLPEYSDTVFQDVATCALGRALGNCGFGTLNSILEDPKALENLSEAPLVIPDVALNPMIPQTTVPSPRANNDNAPPQQTAVKTAPSGQPTNAHPASNAAPAQNPMARNIPPDVAPVKTSEDALAVIMPFGTYKGKTLGEILNVLGKKEVIIHYAGKDSRRYNDARYVNLTAACNLLLNSAQPKLAG